MKKLIAAVLLALALPAVGLAVNPYIMEQQGLSITKADLPTCAANLEGRAFTVNNCVSVASCTTTASPGFAVRLVCDYTGAAWAWRTINATIGAADAGDYVLKTVAATQTIAATGAGNDFNRTAPDDIGDASNDYVGAFVATWGVTAPVATLTAETSTLFDTPISGVSGAREFKVTNVTVADDGAGTKPAGAIPITTDYATCTCNDATGCAMTIAEPTPTSGYGRLLVVASIGTGNCEIADSAGVVELGATLVLEPTSTAVFAHIGAAWHRLSSTDNVP